MGNGNAIYDPVTGVARYFIHLLVAARYDASHVEPGSSTSDLQRWRSSFEHASEILFEASHGQMQFGRVTITNDAPFATETDIHLYNVAGTSYTIAPTDPPFNFRVKLYEHVRQEPLVMVHELGHYVMTLGDEYVVERYGQYKVVRRLCQDDPSTHECPMEFAGGFGLKLDKDGNKSASQPPAIVNRFCLDNHGTSFENPQQARHGESCWDTLAKVHEELELPGGTPNTNVHQAVEWIETLPILRYALAVSSSSSFASPTVEQAIKTAAKEWIYRISVSGDQMSLLLGDTVVISPMQHVHSHDTGKFFSAVDQVNLDVAEDRQLVNKAVEEFADALGAFQRMIVVAPGNSSIALGSLADALPEKRTGLLARTYGFGEFDQQLQQLSKNNKWIHHAGFPIADQELESYAFSLQNELIELYVSSTPGLGIANLLFDRLPAIRDPKFQPATVDSPLDRGLPVVNLEKREQGVDLPVWIEEDAESAIFMLSLPKTEQVDLLLIAPNGTVHRATAHSSPYVLAFDLASEVRGRWIARLLRRQAGGTIPVFLLAAARNRSLGTSVKVEIEGRSVKLRFQSEHRFPLDYVDTTVEIFCLLPDSTAPGDVVRSITLLRDRAFDPQNQESVEVSTGWYVAETQLPAGSYLAVFRARHHGQAIYASNPEGRVNGELVTNDLRPIPPFSRVVRQRFEVAE